MGEIFVKPDTIRLYAAQLNELDAAARAIQTSLSTQPSKGYVADSLEQANSNLNLILDAFSYLVLTTSQALKIGASTMEGTDEKLAGDLR